MPELHWFGLVFIYGNTDTLPAIIVTELPSPTAMLFAQNGTTTFCEGDHVILKASSDSAVSYKWYKDGERFAATSDSVHAATEPGTYQVAVSNGRCETMSNSLQLIVSAGVHIDSISGSTQVFPNQNYTYTIPYEPGNTYQWWATNGTILSGQGTNTVDVTWQQMQNSSISVRESNTNCSDSISLPIQTIIGLSESSINSCALQPNPTTTYFDLVFPQSCLGKHIQITAYNIQGQAVLEKRTVVNDLKITVECAGLDSGMYIISIPEMAFITKLIVQ